MTLNRSIWSAVNSFRGLLYFSLGTIVVLGGWFWFDFCMLDLNPFDHDQREILLHSKISSGLLLDGITAVAAVIFLLSSAVRLILIRCFRAFKRQDV